MDVYLDNSATTRAYGDVGDLVRKVMCEDFGNPSSMHYRGVDAEKYIKEAKETLAKLFECYGIRCIRQSSSNGQYEREM